MQFIYQGPEVPESLLQAHEDGRVVFFCGAGISYPAGLPGFQGLVDQIYAAIGTVRNETENEAYSREQSDAALDMLERRVPGHRLAVRTALARVLVPKLRRKGAKDTHAALLELARNRDGVVRLVTTNFDRIFQHVIARAKPAIASYPAPLLPVPKNSRWDGVVYLHGLLPETVDEGLLNRLVLTSGDFGLAYLTERWAARFVTELFRNYVVCFVGYSINDPVLRYMMDALAADRMLGEFTPQAYALGEFQAGQQTEKAIEWEAKGVTPILYEVPTGSHDHSALHRTLRSWSETYRDGVQGKERIVVEYAMSRPLASTKQDDFVGRMLWALSHDTGLPARRFAEMDPVPPLDWLGPLSDDRYRQNDLARFGVQPHTGLDEKLTFSLTRRPAPYTHAPWMTLVSGGAVDSRLDDVMFQLARWLTRHLNDPELVLWLVHRGGRLNARFLWLVDNRLGELTRLQREGRDEELERLRENAPNSIPHPLMEVVWRMVLTGKVKSPWRELDLYRWADRFARYGLTSSLRLELRELLAPKVALNKPFHWGEDDAGPVEPIDLKQLIDWELVLAADYAHSSLNDLARSESFQSALPILLSEFQQLLRDALDLLRELGEADDRSDRSHWDLPSISPHWQNRGFRDWVVLIEMLRDSWVATYQLDLPRAAQIAQDWFVQPYPTFKRLALFAASHVGVVPLGGWVDWLLADGNWWLWSVETQRETIRLLVQQGATLSDAIRYQLEQGILAGPPREMFRDELEPEKFSRYSDKMVWLRLAKLASNGSALGENARARFTALSDTYTSWRLAKDESDEFSHWMSGTGDPDYEDQRQIEQAPRTRRELVNWLQRPPSKHPFYEDNWRESCRDGFAVSAAALCDLARNGIWPTERWREALQCWGDETLVHRSWRYIAPTLKAMPDEVLLGIAHSATWWLRAASKVLDRHEEIFLALCVRILAMDHENGAETDSFLSRAINHPIGHIAEALLRFWFRSEPNDNQGLPGELKPIFSELCDPQNEQYRHARVLLASRVIALFRVDRDWAVKYLLPRFSWDASPTEARAAWDGFLWSPRLYRPLLAAFKTEFLDTAGHYTSLGEVGRQYAAILTYAALDPADTFSTAELHRAMNAIPQGGLNECARTLVQALEGAGEQREKHWQNRIQPYWQTIWPKSLQFASRNIAEQLAHLAITARGEFPAALATVHGWLQPLEQPHFVVHRLEQSSLCSRFPNDTLSLLDTIIADQSWKPRDLDKCLNAISEAWPDAPQDHRYRRLWEYARQRE